MCKTVCGGVMHGIFTIYRAWTAKLGGNRDVQGIGAKVGCERNQSRLCAAYMKVLKELIKMLKVIQAITCVLYQGLRLYQSLKHIVFPGNLSHRGT